MALAGGRVRGVTSKQQCEYLKRFDATVDLGVLQEQERARAAARLGMGEAEAAVSHRRDNVWPLQLVDIGDEEQREVLFGLLAKLPALIQNYLYGTIFPETMEFQQRRPGRAASSKQKPPTHPGAGRERRRSASYWSGRAFDLN